MMGWHLLRSECEMSPTSLRFNLGPQLVALCRRGEMGCNWRKQVGEGGSLSVYYCDG